MKNCKCMVCGYEFEAQDDDRIDRCPGCGRKFVELAEGPPMMRNRPLKISDETKDAVRKK